MSGKWPICFRLVNMNCSIFPMEATNSGFGLTSLQPSISLYVMREHFLVPFNSLWHWTQVTFLWMMLPSTYGSTSLSHLSFVLLSEALSEALSSTKPSWSSSLKLEFGISSTSAFSRWHCQRMSEMIVVASSTSQEVAFDNGRRRLFHEIARIADFAWRRVGWLL